MPNGTPMPMPIAVLFDVFTPLTVYWMHRLFSQLAPESQQYKDPQAEVPDGHADAGDSVDGVGVGVGFGLGVGVGVIVGVEVEGGGTGGCMSQLLKFQLGAELQAVVTTKLVALRPTHPIRAEPLFGSFDVSRI